MNWGMVWTGISALAAVVGGIVLHCTFLKSSNEGKFTGFKGWLYDFLTFRKMMLESLLRILYLILVIFVTLGSFAVDNVVQCLLTLVLGNVALRIAYEFALIILVICRNTTEISKKLNGKDLKAVEAKEEAKVEEAVNAE